MARDSQSLNFSDRGSDEDRCTIVDGSYRYELVTADIHIHSPLKGGLRPSALIEGVDVDPVTIIRSIETVSS